MKTYRSYYHKCPLCYHALYWRVEPPDWIALCQNDKCALGNQPQRATNLPDAFDAVEQLATRVAP